MDGGAGKDARQLLGTFKYPAANRSKISYGQRRVGSQAKGASQPEWRSQRSRFNDLKDSTVQMPADEDDLPLDAFAATTPSCPSRGLASSSPGMRFQVESPLTGVQHRRRAGPVTRSSYREVTSPHWQSSTTLLSPHAPGLPGGLGSDIEPSEIQLGHAPPVIQGIPLVPTHDLPDRFRSIFSFSVFNAIQSKCFGPIYQKDDNFVLSAPTGSGKTVVMELAICRLLATIKDSRFKVVYQAPTKSLCSERFRDWRAKFAALDLQCAELTGDTDQTQLRSVQHASIIITTPEKWDSMTRKWKDHVRLMQLIKLFLIDEVHILKETRGATLEAVVSRMKSVNSNVRFVALSATVPNSEDIATWLGKDPTNQHLPAHRERFGEEFRPVKLQKFVYGYHSIGNDFAFDKVCDSKLPEVISKHSQRKPIMIFCCTRNSAITTSKNLAKLWMAANPPHRLWNSPKKSIVVQNQDLQATVSAGVAFHHAGLDASDRHAVESGYLEGHISVICCTSTLAVGVNLPCHLVIIKNTVSWQDNCCKEYADLEMMQMLGRAGRPQFDNSATAVILTRKERVSYYQKLVTGSEPLESCLHLNLVDHLNAEIGLGTVTDLESATRWLSGTFFFTRLQKNPTYYKLKEGCDRTDEEELMRQICDKDIKLLQECILVTPQFPLRSTEFGDAMARYYVKFETMKLFLALPPKAKMSEILSAIAQADEFREIRLKPGDKALYKEINKGNGIKFPIKVDIGLTSHKVSLLIQSELGGVELPAAEQYQKHRLAFQQDKGLVFSHVNRLIRCIIDCQISRGDSVSTRHALELARSLGAKVWDNSPLQMKQIDQIGIVAVRKLANAGINSIESLESAEPHRIDTILSKNPPFDSRRYTPENGPLSSSKWTSDLSMRKCQHFSTESQFTASKLQNGHDVALKAEITHMYQHITCYAMCDEIGKQINDMLLQFIAEWWAGIAGTLRQAELKPKLPESLFSGSRVSTVDSITPLKTEISARRRNGKDSDEFSDDCLDDADLIAVVDNLNASGGNRSMTQRSSASKIISKLLSDPISFSESEGPTQLDNGKWACNHRSRCKHLCCREGIDRPSKITGKIGAKLHTGNVPKIDKESKSTRLSAKSSRTDDSRIPGPKRNTHNSHDIKVVDLTSPGTTVKSTPRYKYVKKRNEKDNESPEKSAFVERPATKSSGAKAVEASHFGHLDFLYPRCEEMDDGNNRSSDFGGINVDDLFPSAMDFDVQSSQNDDNFPIYTRPVNEFDYDDNFNRHTEDVIATHESLENELTDYEQYISSPENQNPIAVSQPESSSKFENADSPHVSLDATIFSPTAVDPLLNQGVSSDSSFFHTPLPSRTMKRIRENDKENEPFTGPDPKQPRLHISGYSSTVGALEGWEGIDMALFEEFKDIVDFV
ncbi:conserved hypothetical protein [Uncinocarpus reesii 1704]|uniref:DNA 3'-5' helicase n=1 Tax=Uncinocarpus reesii (strain UAMH 1704) TaxID=336963 RepID=C4JSF8_UNCRE|nr:uncharacterized protein UREG_05397 [Uncinocarpus reesii 1704]EEP80555.1 conserved hypothetical protein [Uncinocarpus reesii 1704]